MKTHSTILTFFLLLLFGGNAFGQVLLNSAQLEREKWYYTLEEALENPDKVYKLSLVNQKLKAIPEEIFTFKNLQLLNLGENKIKEVPEEVSQLKKLQFLSLYSNKVKVLPESLRKLSNLQVLFLGRNKLSEIPVWIGGLGKLRRLDLAYNRLTPAHVNIIKLRLPKAMVTP